MDSFINKRRRLICVSALLAPVIFARCLSAATRPALKLAKSYSRGLSLGDYLVSEKYDGVRVYWTGDSFLTRSGQAIIPPQWWAESLPHRALDGELWLERDAFAALNGLLNQVQASDEQWRRIKFMVFDLPDNQEIFEERYALLVRLVERMHSPHIRYVAQHPCFDHEELMEKLDSVIEKGGEGLMLQRKDSPYVAGRQSGLYKVKRWQDAEAVVVGSTPGRGKYVGVMGALVVETAEGVRFRIGSGFTDAERANPPRLGVVITYRYSGKSKNGVPRFASFLRVYK